MALNRWKVNFEGNERVDLPDFRNMLSRVFADMDYLVKTYFDNEVVPRVLRRYQQGTHAVNTFRVVKDQVRAIQDENQQWLYVNPDTLGATQNLIVPSNTTSYIEVKITESKDDLQTRAFWDTDIGLTGQEFFDDINVRIRYDEQFQVVSSPTPVGNGWITLFEVVVDVGGVITAVTRMDDLFWKPRSFALPPVASRAQVYESSVKDLRSFIDFISAVFTEMKGTGEALENAPWSSFKLLREYQNLFYSGGGDISWEVAGAGILRFTDKIFINVAGRSATYELGINGNNDFPLADGECIYVDIPEGAGPVLTPIIADIADVPVNPSDVSFSPRVMVLFYRKGSTIFGSMDIPELDSGEEAQIGWDLDKQIRQRLGIISESSYEAYTSTVIIALGDSYPAAISKLDAQIANILASNPVEESFLVTNPLGQSVFNAGVISWNPNQNIFDLIVDINGRKVKMDASGGLTEDYRKNSSTQIEFAYPVPKNARVTIWVSVKAGGGGSGSIQVQDEGGVVEPAATVMNFVGAGVTAFQAAPGVTQVNIPGGAIPLNLKKLVKNETGSPIPAGKALAWLDNGTVDLADANITTLSDFAGISETSIPNNGFGYAIKTGFVPGVLASLGLVPGSDVYIGETPGELTGTAPSGLTDTIFKVGRAEPPDGVATPNADDLFLEPEVISTP